VQAKVQQFARATASRDYPTLCHEVLAPSLIQRLAAANVSCPQAMRLFVGSVQNPTLSVAKVTVHGQRASAVVLAGATGQRSSLTTIELVKTKHGWRLASLASPR
jgi:hypothetical protein